MIELYTWTTPNGRKVSIMLEECALPYHVHKINIGTNAEQFTPEYLKINPNGKIPSIVDPDGPDGRPIALMESGAILIYLADKTGKFFPEKSKYPVLQWLMFQMGGVGPMFGQAHHFRKFAPEPVPYAIERYSKEALRLYGVLDKRLGEAEHLAGDYSIADMAIYPWIVPYERQGQKLEDFPHLRRWFEAVRARPAVERAYEKAKAVYPNMGGIRTPEERAILFGQTAASVERAAAGAR
jgi:GSH-dependent disulfide-bond oxidoreductase